MGMATGWRRYGSRTSARAWASFSIVEFRVVESSTLKTRTERSIWRSKPVRTLPGPTSTKTVTPDSIISRMESSQRTGAVTWRMRASRASSPVEMAWESTLVMSGIFSALNGVARKSGSRRRCAGIMRAQWKGAETGRITARLAPLCEAISTARFTAAAEPEMTVCSGEFKFAGETISFSAAFLQMSATSVGERPRIAAMAPCPAGTASCMYFPRTRTNFTAAEKSTPPAATSAEYSPRLWPATKSGTIPCFSNTRYAAMETVRIPGWVFSVSFSASSVPSKQVWVMENASAASASSNTAFDSGKFAARSRPMPQYCEAWPGKRNASLLMKGWGVPRRLAASSNGGSGKLLFDFFVEARAAEFAGDANGVLDSDSIGTAVADDGDAADAEQRRAAVFGGIGALAETVESVFGEHVADLRFEAALDGFFQHGANVLDQSFADLQRDVADEAVADDHVHIAAEYVAAFDVANEVERKLLQARRGFAGQLVAFHFFFADGKQSHARPLGSPDRAVINLAHHCELLDLLGLGINVRADVEDDSDFFLHVWEGGRERRTIHGSERAQHEAGDGHDRASISGRS